MVYWENEKGMVLVVALLLMAVLILLGTTAVMTTTTDLKISGNYKQSEKAFYIAEAGIEEARSRMRDDFTPTADKITDSDPTQTDWAVFIGSASKSEEKGFDSGNSLHSRVDSFQTALDYTVKIVHQTDGAGSILYWGDANGDGINEKSTSGTTFDGKSMSNIYLVTSYGSSFSANKTIEVEMAKNPPMSTPGALYVKALTSIQGSSTNIIGTDQCGGTDVPGIVTTLAASTVDKVGNPTVSGSTSTTWSVVGNGTNMDVQAMINSWKSVANYVYNVDSATHTGMNWGTPTGGTPSSCDVSNIVYYNTSNGTNLTDIKLAGGTSGCGILLIDGDLDINGDFSWYGVVMTSGSVQYTGGGNKNITGALIAGSSADADLVGGNANIAYCSSATSHPSRNLPLRRLSWKDKEE